MRIQTEAADTTELERPEEEVLCALHATLDGIGATLRRVRVRVTRSSGRHLCRLRARFVRGDLLVVEARAASSRAAIRAAANGLREALLQRSGRRERLEPRSGRRVKAACGAGPAEDAPSPRDRPGRAPESRAARAPCRLLLALGESESPAAGLDWALVLARKLRLELHVLRILGEPGRTSAGLDGDWVDVTREVQRILVATRETRAWCDEVLPDAVRAEHVCVRVGDFAEEVATRAVEIDPDMVVLSAGLTPGGHMATRLAHGCGRPVLVAREHMPKCSLLAATDLEDDAFPVLGKAAELAEHLHASVVAFHNVTRARAWDRESASASGKMWFALQQERLEMAADRLLYDGEVLVAEGDDAAVAIVEQARKREADTIVIGSRRRSESKRSKKSTAAEVIERTDRSVIIVPLGDPALAWGNWQAR